MTSNSTLIMLTPKKDQHFMPTLSPEKLKSNKLFSQYLSEDKENIDPINFPYTSSQYNLKVIQPAYEVVRQSPQNLVKNKKREALVSLPVKMLR